MKIEFYVDGITDESVSGWGWYPEQPNRPFHVTVTTNNEKFQLTANKFRADLKAAGKGDGCHSFSFDPRGANGEHTNSILIVESHGAELLNWTRPHSHADFNFDISDTLIYLQAHAHPSGIQRVQLSIMRELVREYATTHNIAFVAYESGEMRQLPNSAVEDLVAAYDRKNGAVMQRIAQELGHTLASFSKLTYETPTQIISLGASWIFHDYYENLYRIKSNNPVKTTQLVYDLIPINQPHHCTSELSEAFTRSINQLLRGADQVIAISQHTGMEVENYAASRGIEIEKTVAIPMGTDIIADPPATVPLNLRPYEGSGFVLFVSTVESRKNHRLIMEVWRELHKEMGDATPTLIFAGRRGWRIDDFFEQLAALNWLDGKIKHLDALSDKEIAWLYANSLFTVFPSLNEGWGLPVTESLSYGKICISSNADSLPEAGMGLTIQIDPHDVRSWIDECRKLIVNPALRRAQEEQIRLNYVPFTWRKYTGTLLGALADVSKKETINRSFLNLNCDQIYWMTAAAQQQYRQDYLHFGNPAAVMPTQHWHAIENHGTWTRHQDAALHFRIPNQQRAALALKIKTPTAGRALQLLISVDDGTPTSFTLSLDQGSAWLYMSLPAYESPEFSVLISAPMLQITSPESDTRTMGFGLDAFAVLSDSDIPPTNRFGLLLQGVHFARP